MFDLDSQIGKWRSHIRTTGNLGAADLEELESHLRDGIDELAASGMDPEEAFIIAVKRLGDAETLTREYAKASTESIWKQLLVPAGTAESRRAMRREVLLVLVAGLLGGVLGKFPALFGHGNLSEDPAVFLKNAGIVAFLPIALYLLRKRALSAGYAVVVGAGFLLGALAVNLFPSFEPGDTEVLAGLHLPIALAALLLLPYAGNGWRRSELRLDYVRFAGETFIYSVLIGLGGAVLMAFTGVMFSFIDLDVDAALANWIAVFGFGAMFVVAAYLVERKKGLIESLAPVLARLFTPLFLAVLIVFLGVALFSGRPIAGDRQVLIWFDLLLALVLGLVLYTMSARDAEETAGGWDAIVLALVVTALAANGVALWGISARLVQFGLSPNKVAALGENLLLLVNLGGLAVAYGRFLAGGLPYHQVVSGQMRYLPVYGLWAAFVVLAFPPLFGFI